MRHLFRELFIDNPMLIEVKRFNRKFLGASKSRGLNTATQVFAVLLYLLLLGVTIQFRQMFQPSWIIQLQTFLLCFVMISLMHGSIAAEREKRTWDVLMTAPVSAAQVVVGKFMLGVLGALVLAGFFLIPVLVVLHPGMSLDASSGVVGESVLQMIIAEVISLSFAFCLAAVTLYISSKVKRAFGAQALMYGLLLIALVVYPMFMGMIFSGRSSASGEFTGIETLFAHPFFAVFFASYVPRSYDNFTEVPGYFGGWQQALFYGTITVFCLWRTSKSLHLKEGVGKMKKRLLSA